MKLKLGNQASISTLTLAGALCFATAGCSFGTAEYNPEEIETSAQDSNSSEGAELSAQPQAAPARPPSNVGESETPLVAPPEQSPGDEAPPTPQLVTAPAPGDAPPAEVAPAQSEQPQPSVQPEPAAPVAPGPRPTLTTSGRQVLDTCGNPFVARGVEQIFGEQLPQGNDWVGLLEEIAASGVNAVRVLAGTDYLTLSDVDALIGTAGERGMVVYVTPYGNAAMGWLEGADVRAMLAKHEKYIIIDAFGEPTFDDRTRFLNDSKDAIRQVREWGYRVPLTVTANQFGRDLPSVLELGAEIVASDPLHNTILGWQAYWGSSGYYQQHYGMSYEEAIEAVARAPFPIQFGLDHITDPPETADFGTLMAGAEANGIGWLWWDWYNPYGPSNNLTTDGTATNLTPTGAAVVEAHAASVQRTSQYACTPAL